MFNEHSEVTFTSHYFSLSLSVFLIFVWVVLVDTNSLQKPATVPAVVVFSQCVPLQCDVLLTCCSGEGEERTTAYKNAGMWLLKETSDCKIGLETPSLGRGQLNFVQDGLDLLRGFGQTAVKGDGLFAVTLMIFGIGVMVYNILYIKFRQVLRQKLASTQ